MPDRLGMILVRNEGVGDMAPSSSDEGC
jgi:hypothetical protein